MSNERIDLTQFEGIMNIEWLFDEQLFVGEQNRWRFAINEYTDTETMSKKEYEEWENGLETVWDSLTSGVACLPDLIAELKRCYEELDKWTEYATYVENVNMDCHQDACAEAGFLWKCTDCGSHFELPENGIYECEFGCDASE